MPKHFFTHQPFPDPTPPYPNPPFFLSCKLTRIVNQNRVVTEPKQPGVHNYSEKGRNFVGDRKIPFLLKLSQLAQCDDERFKLYLENVW